MIPLKQSTAITVPFFAHNADGDAVLSIVDGSWTKKISKNGGAFTTMTVTITEMEGGWYSLPIGTGHSDTPGVLTIYLTASGAKQVNLQFRVHARLPDDLAYPATSGRSTDIDSSGRVLLQPTQAGVTIPTVTAVTNDVGITQTGADKVWSTAARALTDKAGFALADATSDAVIADAVWNALVASYGVANSYGLLLETDLDATISSRSTYAGGVVASVSGDVGGKVLGGGAGTITGTGVRAVDASGANIAPASTALSNATWTDVKAGYLDQAVSGINTDTDEILTRLPDASPGGAGGLPTVDASNRVAGVSGNVAGSVASVTAAVTAGAISANAITAAAIQDGAITAAKVATGAIDADALATDTVTEIANGILDLADGVETGFTLRQAQRLQVAAAAGKLDGAATTTIHVRDLADSKNRITATVDSDGNRTAVTRDVT